MPKAYVETYGCQMNASDGELMQGVLAAQGYEIAATPEEADVILVNTCAIREHAEQRVLGRVGQLNRLKRERPGLIIGVTGCMAQRMGEALLEQAPYVELVMGPDGYRGLPEALAVIAAARAGRSGGAVQEGGEGGEELARRALPVLPAAVVAAGVDRGLAASSRAAAGRAVGERGSTAEPAGSGIPAGDLAAAEPGGRGRDRLAVLSFQPHENYEGLEIRRNSRIGAWVPVQRGCNHRCTYCIVPYVRGDEKNRDPERVLAEVREIAGQGIPEVTLLGQTVNSYRNGDWDFPRLLRAVARVDGIRRVRFTSPHPNDVSPALVAVMAEEPAVCKQLHLPAQSGHDRTLKRMLRRHTVATYLEKVALVRSAIPEIALSTDIIVAFPGESESEYEATLELLRMVRFDDAYLYKYSPRDGTPATRLPRDQFIAEDVAQRRLERIIALHRGIQAQINRGEVGRTVEVLVEREARSAGDVLGRTGGNKVVAFPGDRSLIGSFAHVRLTGTTGATFTGESVDPPSRVGRVA